MGTFEEGTNSLSRNICEQLPTHAAEKPGRSTISTTLQKKSEISCV